MVDKQRAEVWLACVTEMLAKHLPYHEPYWVTSAHSLAMPSVVHPAFGNCFDWHSSVHMHWSGLRLLAEHPDLVSADRAREVVASNLTTANLDAEARFLAERSTYERPYGRAWALALVAQIETRRPEFLAGLDLGAFRSELVGSLAVFCEQLVRPERAGQHRNTAFNLLIAVQAARQLGESDLVQTIEATALRLFGDDRDAPAHLEPSGEDFLSPTLAEAHLMSEVSDDFSNWLSRWLPKLDEGLDAALAQPIEVPATEDPRTVHLHGLNLSRAFHLSALASALGPGDARATALLDARANYGTAVLEQAVRGDFGSDHWLVTYGLLALHSVD